MKLNDYRESLGYVNSQLNILQDTSSRSRHFLFSNSHEVQIGATLAYEYLDDNGLSDGEIVRSTRKIRRYSLSS